MYNEIQGTYFQKAGASGTENIPAGAQLLQCVVHSTAGGTVAFLGGTAVPIIANAAPTTFRFLHRLMTPLAASTVVFTGTDSYFLEYVKPGGT
jgi:hypothetical protein